jgi:hypothetical protein
VDVLLAFLLRLAGGLAAGMAVLPARQVTSGYYRNNLYVLLGSHLLAGLAAWRLKTAAAAWCATGAVLSYLGAVCWLYEQRRAGRLALWLLAAIALAGAWTAQRPWQYQAAGPVSSAGARNVQLAAALRWCEAPLSGALVGGSVAAMLLGHWYLNAPGMQLAPLVRLLRWLLACVVLRAAASAVSAWAAWGLGVPAGEAWFLALRWAIGLAGTAVLLVMAGRSLGVPNTQSATGILYVAVIAAFAGELLALLLAGRHAFAL